MFILRIALFAFLFLFIYSCEKAVPFKEPDPVFEVFVKNEYFEIQAKYALFLSNEDGETIAFRWLNGQDTTHIQAPGTSPDDRFDCTILRVATLEAPGTGLRDTTLTLQTYTQITSGQQINLRDLFFHQVSTLRFTLTGFNTLDSIVVSDALTLSRPQANNNYYGEYRLNNTGRCWLRVLINGEHFWRFLVFNNVSELVDAHTIDASQLLFLLAPPLPIEFPFVSTWQYKLDGVVDSAQYRFFPLSQHVRAPGGAVPVFNSDQVFEPVNNDLFEPNRPYINMFRLQTKGPEGSSNGYTYYSDGFYSAVPASLPEPTFDLLPTTLANNRVVAVTCSGNFDVLSFVRTRTGTPNINWEVTTRPLNGIVLYRLPDVPVTLGNLYPSLKNYDFNSAVKARAESYLLLDYEEALRQKLLNADPLWQARGIYIGREENF